jgi:type IV secretion system protein VirB6
MVGGGGGREGGVEAGLVSRVEAIDAVIGQILYPEREPGSGPVVAPRAAAAVGPDAANLAGSELSPDVRAQLSSADSTMILALLVSSVGLRIALGILLAVAPLFVAALLFGGTRTLFAGWVRAVAGTMIGLVGVPIVTAFELALIEPQAGALARAFSTGTALGAIAERLWLTSTLFAAVLAVVLVLIGRAAATLQFPGLTHLVIDRAERAVDPWFRQGKGQMQAHAFPSLTVRDHAQHVADAARSAERRDDPPARTATFSSIIERQRDGRQPVLASVVATDQRSSSRVTSGRMSAAAQRRDGS